VEIASFGDKWDWTPVIEDLGSDDEEVHGMGGKPQVGRGGIKPPAERVIKAQLVKQVKKLEAKVLKLKELKTSKNVKNGVGEAYGEDGKSYKDLYEKAKTDYDGEYQKRVDCEKDITRLEADIRNLKSDIETLKSDKVKLAHEKEILEKEIKYKEKALTKAEKEVGYFKNILHPPQVSQYPSTSTLGGTSISQRGLSRQDIEANGFVSPP